jgi:hypothetical protein
MKTWKYNFTILDLGSRWRLVVSFTARPLYPLERAIGIHWIGSRVGPRDSLDAVSGIEPRLSKF